MDTSLRALNRFGLGARPGERSRVRDDPRGWLRAQLEGAAPLLPASDVPSAEGVTQALRALRAAVTGDAARRAEARCRLIDLARREAEAALKSRVISDRPFVERLVAFWSNHLCVSTSRRLLVTPLAGSYEREAIRPHVLGRFEDLVLASAKHPAMLVYLDNFQSIGPASRAAGLGNRRGAERGLNENYARELLELHTLGVDGGYTQQDVQQLACILTGWTVAGLAARDGVMRFLRRNPQLADRVQATSGGPIRFTFVDLLHEPGSKTLIGNSYAEAGVAEGEEAIRALCRHPATARFVATKLVRHFVADQPPASAVERIERVFRDSGGDLSALASALVELPEAWQQENTKFRSPQDWLVALLRAAGSASPDPRLLVALRQLRQPLWAPPSPAGYPDTRADWADPDSLLNRAELARTIARGSAAQVEPAALLDVVDVGAGDPLRALLTDDTIDPVERVALAFAGPAFQWR